jgi:DNA replication protein
MGRGDHRMEEMMYLIKDGTITFSKLLFRHYRKLKLTDMEFLLLLHLHVLIQEGKTLPTVQEISERMEADTSQVVLLLQSLIKSGTIRIDQEYDPWGKLSEHYNLTPLYERLANQIFPDRSKTPTHTLNVDQNIFTTFEMEFGRPLSPIEMEQINQWLEKDRYDTELIMAALREASLLSKLSFRYIDRILLEWEKNQIRTVDEAKEFSLRFRDKQFQRMEQLRNQDRRSREEEVNKAPRFPQFNWLKESAKD